MTLTDETRTKLLELAERVKQLDTEYQAANQQAHEARDRFTAADGEARRLYAARQDAEAELWRLVRSQ